MSLKISNKASNILKVIGWLAVLIVFVLLAKIFIWERGYYANKTKELRTPATAVITEIASAINPSETAPTEEEINQHQVSADEPRYLTIERLDLRKVIVEKTSVNAHVLQVPSNIHEVAWYSGSARPGTGGYIIVSGLASSDSGAAGAFANLDSLEKDNEIKIITGSDEEYIYNVYSVSLVDKSNAKEKLTQVQNTIDGKETLVLVTNIKSAGSSKYDSVAIVQAIKK